MTVNCTIEVVPIVDVAVNKTVDNEFHYLEDIVVWTIKVSNAYNGTNATDVVMRDILPAEFEFISYTSTVGSYDAVSGAWTIGFMGNGTEETLVITSLAKAVGTFINFANVTCNETDWDKDNNFDNATVTVVDLTPVADLEVIKLSDNCKPNTNIYYKGNTVTWTIIVINHGPDDAVNAVARDLLPSGVVYVSDDSQGAFDHNTGIWNIGDLANGASVTLNIVTNISITNARITNPVNVTSDTYDPNKTNNYDNNTIVVAPEADLEIVKLVSQATSRANDIVTWTLIVKNNGPDTAVDAVVSDKLPSKVVYVSDDSNGAYNHKTGVWKLGNLAKGQSKVLKIKTIVKGTNRTITNFANVTSKTYDPNESNNKCNNSTKVGPVADLMIIKNVDKDTVTVGQKVVFTIVVVNLGPDTAVNTRAFDLLPDGLKLISFKVSRGTYDPVTGIWDIGDLECGETVEMTIVAKALVVGKIVNEAYVESDTYDNDTSNNYDNATVTVVEVPEPPVSLLQKYPTGNPFVMVLLALLTIVGVGIRRRN
jgi:uncharacterized repeat protein (TIGR01451 family)